MRIFSTMSEDAIRNELLYSLVKASAFTLQAKNTVQSYAQDEYRDFIEFCVQMQESTVDGSTTRTCEQMIHATEQLRQIIKGTTTDASTIAMMQVNGYLHVASECATALDEIQDQKKGA